MRRLFTCVICLLTLLVATGCGVSGTARTSNETTLEAKVWPSPPAEPRVRYVRSFSGPGDLGIAKPVFRRLYDALVGQGDDRFVRPTGVAERNGVVYIADPGTPALWILDSARNRYLKLEEIGDARLVSPVAVAVRPDGAVFVADSALGVVLLLDADGKLVRIAAKQDLARPAALAFDATSEQLYVADSARHRIAVYGPDGAIVRTVGEPGTADGEFNYPTHLAIDRDGTLVVTDALNFRVQAFDRRGAFKWKFGRQGDGSGDLAAPKGIATDIDGHVYLVDALFDDVQIFAPDGTFLLSFGERGMRPGQFWLPGGLFINAENRIFVADAYNRRVQVFSAPSETSAPPPK